MAQDITPLSDVSLRGYTAARQAAGLVHRSELGRLVVSGPDRSTFLQGLLTNDIVALTAGRGCYAAYLTPQGRMITDLWVYEIGDVLLLVMPRTMTSSVLTKLDQLVFSEDVKLGDVSDTFRSVAVVGPRAADAVASVVSVSSETLKGLPAHGNVRVEMNGRPAVVLQIDDIGERGYEALVEPGDDTRLIDGLHRYGVVDIDDAAAEALRIEAGIPKFGRDMDHDTIPLEAGIQDRAISLNKGCYVGQEVIIRVLHRGHGRVARKLVGLVAFGGAGVFPGARIFADGRDVGEITSASHSPRLDRRIALGYVHRDSASPGASLTIGSVTAVVSALPFATKGGE